MDDRTRQVGGQDAPGLVTVQSAATALGISVEAVRKRLQRGQLHGERHGGRWYVDLSRQDSKSGQDQSRTEPGQDQQSSPDVQGLISHLQTENKRLWERLERAEEERAELRRMLNLEQQTVRSLTEGRQLPEAYLRAEKVTSASPIDNTPERLDVYVPDQPAVSAPPMPNTPVEATRADSDAAGAEQEPALISTARRPWWRRLLGGS